MTDLAALRALPQSTRVAIFKALRRGLEPLKAVDPEQLSTWAAKNFVMSEESSHKRGMWEAWPFQLGWLDAFSNDEIVEVDVEKAKRTGFTKALVAFAAYNAAHRRRKQAIWQPTDTDSNSFSKSEISAAFEICPALKPVLRSGTENDTMSFKRFRGSVLHLLGAKSATNFRRITLAVAILDEIDAMDQIVEKTIDPFTGAFGRLEGAAFPKIVVGTTPRIKGLSHIRRRVDAADVRMRYQISCPHCDVEHPLLWGGPSQAHGFKWDGKDPKVAPATVRHVCPHCHESVSQADYLAVYGRGAWVDDGGRYRYDHHLKVWIDGAGAVCPPPRHVAFVGLWTAYSPQRAWGDIVREFLEARATQKTGDDAPMQGFTNETLAEVWEVTGDRVEHHVLQQRAERYPLGWVPRGALKLTCGIDVQSSGRWELSVWGWGRGLESWLVAHDILVGNPSDPEDWDQVAAYLDRRFPLVGYAGTLGIDSSSIDSSNDTHAVYAFVRQQRTKRRIHAIKGLPGMKPIKCPATLQDVDWKGQRFPGGVKLWGVGVDTAKDLLHGQLALLPNESGPTPGCVHFSDELQREFFEQLTAEQRILKRTPRGEAHVWVKRRARNEVLDCRNYATHAAYMLGLDRYSDAQWITVEAVVHQIPLGADAPRPAVELTPGPVRRAAPRVAQQQRPTFGRAW